MPTEFGTPNIYTVLNTMVIVVGPVLTTIVAYILTRNRSIQQEKKTDIMSANAEAAAVASAKNTDSIEEVHKTVNGRNARLKAEIRKLKSQLERAEGELHNRRQSDRR